MHLSDYLSNLKWLSKSFKLIISKIENWPTVLLFYSIPRQSGSMLVIEFRNGLKLKVPENYDFEPIAETLLQNVYGFDQSTSGAVIIDIGASIGDFVLFVSSIDCPRVYAFEPNPRIFSYLRENISLNAFDSVRIFNAGATAETLRWILEECRESRIDFLKIDCDGCEYDLLVHCSTGVLLRIKKIALEIHSLKGRRKEEIIVRLRSAGFHVRQIHRPGEGHYIHGIRGEWQ